jgi:hypothetical protein
VVSIVQKKQARSNTLFSTVGVARIQIWVLRSNLYSFGNISIISGITQIDQCKVTCFTPSSVVTHISRYYTIKGKVRPKTETEGPEGGEDVEV